MKWIDESDLPKLQSIQLGQYALTGDWRPSRIKMNGNYKNSLTMKSKNELIDE